LLRTKLLRWLLAPLALLLTADTFVNYWFALRFADQAHDRALVEIARDASLYLRIRMAERTSTCRRLLGR
jgi:hypothetical protein